MAKLIKMNKSSFKPVALIMETEDEFNLIKGLLWMSGERRKDSADNFSMTVNNNLHSAMCAKPVNN